MQCSDGLVSLYYVLSYLLLLLLSDTKVQGFEPSAVLTYIIEHIYIYWAFLCDPAPQTNVGIKLLRHLKGVNHNRVLGLMQ